ncbi:MAG: hypothetical protein N2513_07205 [Deltaproteobacteria bacterium]|nr:hypothetical protein [Deltaproteobacteria bacterium]
MEKDELIIKREGRVYYAVINREEALNALNKSVLTKLDHLFD